MKCPLCGGTVAGAWSAARTDAATALRERVATLTRRVDELERGALTPRDIKDDTLWLCAECQRLMTDRTALDRQEIQRRIRDHVRELEGGLAAARRRASR